MTFGHTWLRQIAFGLALLLGVHSAALAVGWFDDFDDGSATDGNPVTWSEDLLGFFPGTYDASSGDYQLSNPGTTDGDIMVAWVDSPSFTDTYIRTQGVVLPDPVDPVNNTGGNLVLLGRIDTSTVSSYVLYFDTGGSLVLQVSIGGGVTNVADVDLDFNAASEVIMELNVVGNTLSGYAWQPGDSKPETPQVTYTDVENLFPSGPAGIAYAEDDDGTIGVFRYAAAQDTPFVDTLPGDFNNDGKVDAADYTVWRDGLNGDFTEEDYTEWVDNFGAGTGGGGAAAIPEPAGLLLGFFAMTLGAGFVSLWRR